MTLVGEILTGHVNLLLGKEEELDQQRYKICLACAHYNVKLNSCPFCSCKMAAKRRSPKSKCPKGKW